MSRWTVAVDVDDAAKGPEFVRIARAIARDIQRGRLRGGDALPGSRALADTLGVHRNTVLAAFRELAAEGWIETEPARGTFVAREVANVTPRRFSKLATQVAGRPGFALGPDRTESARHAEPLARANAALATVQASGTLSLGGGVPDVRFVPHAELARAIRRILTRRPVEVLSYGAPEGPLRLREALARMVSATRSVSARAENLLVTRGSQMAIDLVARTLIAPGDAIVVEALGYSPAWEALRSAGAELIPLPVDRAGLSTDALQAVVRERAIRGLYVTPHHQFPTTVTLSGARRLRILELARAHRFFVLEDDYDHEFHYEGRPVLPLASSDDHGVVLYVGTLSKVLAPGMRIGFLVAPEPVVARLAAVRRRVDRQGDHLLEEAVADLLEEGEIQRHIRRARRVYIERRARLAETLTRAFSSTLTFSLPPGGTAIWAEVDRAVDVDLWAERARERDLILQPARQFAFDGRGRPFLRLGFAQHDEREMLEAIRRLGSALDAVSGRGKARPGRARRGSRSNP